MNRSRLRNNLIKNLGNENKSKYTKYRNYCTRLFRKEKKLFYSNLNTKVVTDNKTFWKTMKPLFSEKHFSNNKITLIEGGDIISDDQELAEIFNSYFANVVKNLDIEGFKTYDYNYIPELDYISNIIEKFKNHPSIQRIKENVKIEKRVHFSIDSLDKRKPTTHNNLPTRVLVENKDIISPFVTEIYNESTQNANFPNALKLADVTPTFKKEDRTTKGNYRNVSILPPISQIFEKYIFVQITLYIDKYLSPYLCGFRKGYSTQHCLTVMLNMWKKAMDSGKIAGALIMNS